MIKTLSLLFCRLGIIIFLLINNLYAVNINDINNDLKKVSTRIKQMNFIIDNKTQKAMEINKSINNTQLAIDDLNEALKNLSYEEQINLDEVNKVQQNINELEVLLKSISENINLAIEQIYKQILSLDNSSSFISSDERAQLKRKNLYLIKILQYELAKFHTLKNKIEELKKLNEQLQIKINILKTKLQEKSKKKSALKNKVNSKLLQKMELDEEIKKKKREVSILQEMQRQLNSMLSNLDSNNNVTGDFFKNKTHRPVNGKIILGYKELRNQIVNNGLVIETDNKPVYAINDGVVVYVGNIIGIGQVVIVNHSNNYTSIYGGIKNPISVGKKVTTGMIIANSGNKQSQLIGGFYFELRHLGKPIDPNFLFK